MPLQSKMTSQQDPNTTSDKYQEYYFAPSQTTARKPRHLSPDETAADVNLDPYTLEQGQGQSDRMEKFTARRLDSTQMNDQGGGGESGVYPTGPIISAHDRLPQGSGLSYPPEAERQADRDRAENADVDIGNMTLDQILGRIEPRVGVSGVGGSGGQSGRGLGEEEYEYEDYSFAAMPENAEDL